MTNLRDKGLEFVIIATIQGVKNLSDERSLNKTVTIPFQKLQRDNPVISSLPTCVASK